ncbi:hypothetical protein [Pseudomonas fluorescens]|uniref:Uncharacterized protein n=1 Tax=Pseudomonas fluorescens TaxID=294 RepID=A0A0F4VGW4_PSEFL|nr:hypothetical protein [Pseudomonas fluorescens]KJZ67267.1 hypothetical protein VD17_03130 [Pseudomonas fluorescens]
MLKNKIQISDEFEVFPVEEIMFNGRLQDVYEIRRNLDAGTSATVARLTVPGRSTVAHVIESVERAINNCINI